MQHKTEAQLCLQEWAAGRYTQANSPAIVAELEALGYLERIDPDGKLDLTSKGRLALAYANGN